ncbi:S-adenosyl-L-methionine-dependent methyltransferase [Podospora fimiseda]|uniref:Leucine carboxyl methyltransferase 1 n=1 Tax=Podospora fimiseda TaxID=252190 RepID=A0AAN7H6Q2_9PEZI|nr:S-adenosyl-L-methionine-dependent methyltransferase [Podospora fimiseda]
MSAPSIPNLLSLLGGRGSRGRSRGGSTGTTTNQSSSSSHDATIQGTDTDASISRLSAVDLGYLRDPFASHFVTQRQRSSPTRRLPIINRGTYTRTTGIDFLVSKFLSSTDPTKPRQIISLGAGTDTRSLQLFSSFAHQNISYHEIDFPTMIGKKQFVICTALWTLLSPLNPSSEPNTSSTTYSFTRSPSNTLTLHPLDLRSLTQSLPLPNLSPSHPTLIISECCLCYLPPSTTSQIISSLSTHFPSSGIIIYEPIEPHDAFGKMMVSNLAARGIEMPTLEEYPTQASQEERLRREGGFTQVKSKTIDKVWDDWVSLVEKERVDELEGGLDEVEEWKLLAGHYLIVWGWKGDGLEMRE